MGRNSLVLAVAVGAILAADRVAGAQTGPRAALVLAYPSSVGLLVHASDVLALRGDFSGTYSNVNGSSGGQQSWSLTAGVSALITLARWDSTTAYVAPRFGLTRVHPPVGPGSNQYAIDGSFGIEHALSRRLGIFAEVGIENRFRSFTSVQGQQLYETVWYPRSGIGAVVRF